MKLNKVIKHLENRILLVKTSRDNEVSIEEVEKMLDEILNRLKECV